jgi:hypothetical protein
MQELLRLRNHLTRVIAENNHFLAAKCLESVMAYNQQLETELDALNQLINRSMTA